MKRYIGGEKWTKPNFNQIYIVQLTENAIAFVTLRLIFNDCWKSRECIQRLAIENELLF